MNFQEAKRRLRIHAGYELDERETGLLGSLRPYRPAQEPHIADVVACLIAIHPTVSTASLVERDLVGPLWHLCELSRTWATRPDGLLRRNRLAPEPDLDLLTDWLEAIERFCVRMFSGLDLPHCLSRVTELLAQGRFQSAPSFAFLAPLLDQLQTSPDPDDPDAADLARDAARAASRLRSRQ